MTLKQVIPLISKGVFKITTGNDEEKVLFCNIDTPCEDCPYTFNSDHCHNFRFFAFPEQYPAFKQQYPELLI